MNSYELDGRARKVALMLAAVPPAGDALHAAEQASYFAAFEWAERTAWAFGAGCKRPPSDETWAEFVEAVRARPSQGRDSETRMRAAGRADS